MRTTKPAITGAPIIAKPNTIDKKTVNVSEDFIFVVPKQALISNDFSCVRSSSSSVVR